MRRRVYFRMVDSTPLALLPDISYAGDVYKMMYFQEGRKIEEAGGSLEDVLGNSVRANPTQYGPLEKFLKEKGYELVIL